VLGVVSILEGPVCVVDCVSAPEGCQRKRPRCVTREVWSKVESSIKQSMEHITLKELVGQTEG